jgi:magnesium chelatase family protein
MLLEIDSLNEICGNPHAKRAIEVALAGHFTIRFLGSPASEAESLAHYVNAQYGLADWESPCPCGNFSNPSRECTCAPDVAAAHRQRVRNGCGVFALEVEVPDCTPGTIMAWLSGRQGEDSEKMLNRIENTPSYPSLELDDTAVALLKSAITHLGLGYQRVRCVIEVARKIADLANSEFIHVTFIAEAIQYIPRGFDHR